MMKSIIIITIIILSLHLTSEKNTISGKYKIIAETYGDLNADGIDEKVSVLETIEKSESGNTRLIQIYRNINGMWILWHSSENAILKYQKDIMMSDPFDGIEIDHGTLLIAFSGGSSWKWSYTDKYRYQNNQFELIGYTSDYFKLCEYWLTVDYNLSTGKLITTKEFEKCENQEQIIYKTENEMFFKSNIDINLQNRNTKEVTIITPKYKRQIFI
ncbi:hypothetical protein JCM19296_3598 [Nonlabens ulvanivorans]|uniref:Uncharacterized protein n=2 Tax=Nonlabens TaxID=363408 RepID=A0A081DGE3_NONUL|nr:hypothetical protein JCM19296_3598 [Nonlabens ulvanivorans]